MLTLQCRCTIKYRIIFRSKIHSEESSMADVMRWYNTVNAALLDHLTNQIKETDNSGVWRYVIHNNFQPFFKFHKPQYFDNISQ